MCITEPCLSGQQRHTLHINHAMQLYYILLFPQLKLLHNTHRFLTTSNPPGRSNMQKYKYTQLCQATDEIRLLGLLPGSPCDPMRITISHHSLVSPTVINTPTKWTLDQVRQTLPKGWWAGEMVEGRMIFVNENDSTSGSTWTHPGASIPPDCYNPLGEVQKAAEPRYEALSYTWGSPADPETALVIDPNDSSRVGTLEIGQNLASALHHFRHHSQPRTFWIDAICINQDDLVERSAQVARMGQIYTLAERVVVWLGREDGTSSLAMSTLDYLGSQVVYTKDNHFFASPDCAADKRDWYGSRFILPYHGTTWQAIHALCQRSWFERIWIMQEIQLAGSNTTLQCGLDVVSWSRFRAALMNIHCKRAGIPPYLDMRFPSSLCRDMPAMPLHEILLLANVRKCGDDRDRIYGILSMAPSWSYRASAGLHGVDSGGVQGYVFALYTEDKTSQSPVVFWHVGDGWLAFVGARLSPR